MKNLLVKIMPVLALMITGLMPLRAQLVYEKIGNNGVLTFGGPQLVSGSYPMSTTWYSYFGGHAWVFYDGKNIQMRETQNGRLLFGSSTGTIEFAEYQSGQGWVNTVYNNVEAGNYMAWVGGYYTYSDLAAKTNIVPVSSALNTILALKPVTYQWRDNSMNRVARAAANPKEIGFIAQDLEQVIPDIVAIDDENKRLVNYQALIPVLTGAIQELNARIEALERQLGVR